MTSQTQDARPSDDLVVLHRETHGNLRLNRKVRDFSFARESITAALTAGELAAACVEFPCVMARQPDGNFSLLAVTGLQAGQNLFVADDGTWAGDYLPATLATWPFRLAREGGDDGRFLVAVQPGALSASEGDPLFDAQGQETPWLLETLRWLTQTDAGLKETGELVAALDAQGLLVERTLQAVLADGRDVELNGFLSVDEARLQELSPAAVHELHARGALPMAYLHLLSMRRFRHLVTRAGQQLKVSGELQAVEA